MRRGRDRRTRRRRERRTSTSAATRIASRVFPTPPAPVTVTSRASCSAAATPASSVPRPTNDVSWTGRLLANVRGRSGRSALQIRQCVSGRVGLHQCGQPETPEGFGPDRERSRALIARSSESSSAPGAKPNSPSDGASALKRAECFGLLATPVQRHHEQRPPALAEGLLRDQVVAGTPAVHGVCLVPARPRPAPRPTQRYCSSKPSASHRPGATSRGRRARRLSRVRKRRREGVRRRFPFAVFGGTSSLGDRVARSDGCRHLRSARNTYPVGRVSIASGPNTLRSRSHEVLDDLRARPRRIVAPDRVDEPVAADDLALPGREQREHGSLVAPRDRQCAVRTGDLERSENCVLERARIVALALRRRGPAEAVRPSEDQSKTVPDDVRWYEMGRHDCGREVSP